MKMSQRRVLFFFLIAAVGVLASISSGAAARQRPVAHSAANHYLTGVGDENAQMFLDPNWRQLHTRIARYIAPYDAAVHVADLNRAKLWIARAQAAHVQVLVAFYHSEVSPTRMPSVATYQADVQKFLADFPQVKQYQAWNETNRGNVAHAFASPTPSQAAAYYAAIARVCRGCSITSLDILDQNNVRPTLQYIAQFKSAARRMHIRLSSLWGLHNYSDTNRFGSSRTRAIVHAVGGTVWLTETGGIVKFGGAFPNKRGSGLSRAAKALSYMFKLAAGNSHIKRLYIFQWLGANSRARFDAGLTDAHFHPRPGFVVVCRKLHGAHCNVRTSRS